MNPREHADSLDQAVLKPMWTTSKAYYAALAVSGATMLMLFGCWGYMIAKGMGVAGITVPVSWGVFIVNFVFWVGIAHSGTLISAVLYLFRAKFRAAFNRSAEAMTLIAVMTAGMYPLIHLGRVWYFYWLFPYPNQRLVWPNFRSPLVWDVFAISTYFTVSAIFFYIGLIPDLALVRRSTTGFKRWIYGVLSLGWQGTQNQWRHYNKVYLFLAAFATPLVVSVHSVVSWDFAMAVIPGFHTTIFAPYFVAGAIFSGTAMVFTLVIPMRKIFGLEQLIKIDHFDRLSQLMLVTSLVVAYAYAAEWWLALYNGNVFEVGHFMYRLTGDYKELYWIMVFCNCIAPLSLFFRFFRRNLVALFILSILVNIGMYLERFVIIIVSLSKDFDPYNWGLYKPTFIEIGITIGSFGFFFFMFLLFAKVLPTVAVTEVKEQVV